MYPLPHPLADRRATRWSSSSRSTACGRTRRRRRRSRSTCRSPRPSQPKGAAHSSRSLVRTADESRGHDTRSEESRCVSYVFKKNQASVFQISDIITRVTVLYGSLFAPARRYTQNTNHNRIAFVWNVTSSLQPGPALLLAVLSRRHDVPLNVLAPVIGWGKG